MVKALETAAQQCRSGRLQIVLAAVVKDIRGGHSLSQSFSHHSDVFSGMYVHMVSVGEAAGNLDEVLLRLARQVEKTAALGRRVRLAMIYPAVILSVAAGAVTFLLAFIVPTFAEMFRDFGADLPAPTRLVLTLSNLLSSNIIYAAGLLLSGALLSRYAATTPAGRRRLDEWKLRLPVLGPLIRQSLTSRFCRTLGTLLSSGVALVDALDILSKSSGNHLLEANVRDMLRQVSRGKSLAQPLTQSAFFPPMVTQMIVVGEETSEIDVLLLHAADYLDEQVDTLVDSLTSIIEPVLIVLIGGILGGILVAMYLPMFDLVNVIR
jgi:type IV pilus assembly protein PilC